MKKIYVLSAVSLWLVLMITGISNEQAVSYTSGAPEGMTGSPGDGDHCGTSCHATDPGTPTGDELVSLVTNIPQTGYLPGVTYDLTATMTDSAVTKFGFEISPQNIAGDLIGTLIAGPETGLVGLGGYVTHDFANTSGSGSRSWAFQWTAPEEGTGDVTFYGAYNFTNANGQTNGDVVVLADTTVSEGESTGVEENSSMKLSVYPNPVVDFLYVEGISSMATYQLIDMTGKVIQSGSVDVNKPILIDHSVVRSGLHLLDIKSDQIQRLTRVVIK